MTASDTGVPTAVSMANNVEYKTTVQSLMPNRTPRIQGCCACPAKRGWRDVASCVGRRAPRCQKHSIPRHIGSRLVQVSNVDDTLTVCEEQTADRTHELNANLADAQISLGRATTDPCKAVYRWIKVLSRNVYEKPCCSYPCPFPCFYPYRYPAFPWLPLPSPNVFRTFEDLVAGQHRSRNMREGSLNAAAEDSGSWSLVAGEYGCQTMQERLL